MAHGTGPVFGLGAAALKHHNTSDCRFQLGALAEDSGHLYMYVQADAAISANNIVAMQEARTSFDNITSFDNTSDRAIEKYPSITDSGLSLTVGAHVGDFVYIDAGTGAGQMKRIVKNSATQIWFAALHPGFLESNEGDTFATDPDTTSDITIISPFHVIKAPATTLTTPVIGVAPLAFTTKYYGWICVRGVCLAGSGTTAAALVAGVYVTPGDNTAGQCTGLANGETIDDVHIFGTALHAAADDQTAPIWIHGNVL